MNGMVDTAKKMMAPGTSDPNQQASPQEQDLFNRFEINTLNMLYYDGKNADKIYQSLDPKQTIATTALSAVSIVESSREETVKKHKTPVTPEMTSKVLNLAVGEIENIAKVSGKFTLTPEQKAESLKLAYQQILSNDRKRGLIDDNKFKQFLKESGGIQ